MKLYHHKTSGGAEYLTDKFIVCPNGEKEGVFEGANFIVRIDGDITKDAELSVRTQPDNEDAQGILQMQTRHIPFTADKDGFAVIKTATNFRVEIGAKSNPVAQAVKELIIRAVNAYKP